MSNKQVYEIQWHLFQKDFYLPGLIIWTVFLFLKAAILKQQPLVSYQLE